MIETKRYSIPPSWTIAKLGDVIISVSTNNKKLKQKEYQESGKFPVIDQGQEYIGGYSDDEKLLLDFEPPAVVFGDHTKVKKFVNFKFIVGADGVKVLKPFNCFDPKLFYYFLHCIKLVDKGYARHYQYLVKELIPIPPLPEQHRIVAKLEELFSLLDSAVVFLKKAKEQIKTYKQSVLSSAFCGKLTIDNGQLKINRETGLPEGWNWVTFDDVCNKIGDVDHKMPKSVPDGIPYLSTKDFTNDFKLSFNNVKLISKEDYNQLSKKIKPEKWDIIFPRYGTIGKNILVDTDIDFLVSYSCAVVKPKKDRILPHYIYYYSHSPQIKKEIDKYTVETTQANIGIASIKQFIFPLPKNKDEQEQIVSEIERRFSQAENIEKTIDLSLKQAESLRQSILKKAFEGRLVPQDPNDEPAEKLLERIKKEKKK